MDEAWKEFMSTGKVTDYLRFKRAESLQLQSGAGVQRKREEPDGTEYCGDRNGSDSHADWRV